MALVSRLYVSDSLQYFCVPHVHFPTHHSFIYCLLAIRCTVCIVHLFGRVYYCTLLYIIEEHLIIASHMHKIEIYM